MKYPRDRLHDAQLAKIAELRRQREIRDRAEARAKPSQPGLMALPLAPKPKRIVRIF